MQSLKHAARLLAESFAETVWPTRCVGCDLPGALLCDECASALPLIDTRLACPYCAAPCGWLVCTECLDAHPPDEDAPRAAPFPFLAARAACSYEGVAKRLITAYKDGDELRLDAIIASYICKAIQGAIVTQQEAPNIPAAEPAHAPQESTLPHDWSVWADALVAIPANPTNLRKRGYDHMEHIAQAISKQLDLPLLHPLVSSKAADQRHLGSQQRAKNRQGSITLAADAPPLPPHIVLVDDVLTTGATATAATEALLDGGATEVCAAVFARVW